MIFLSILKKLVMDILFIVVYTKDGLLQFLKIRCDKSK